MGSLLGMQFREEEQGQEQEQIRCSTRKGDHDSSRHDKCSAGQSIHRRAIHRRNMDLSTCAMPGATRLVKPTESGLDQGAGAGGGIGHGEAQLLHQICCM